MQPISVTVMLWRNISVVNKTNISGFTFFFKVFVYSFAFLLRLSYRGTMLDKITLFV